MLGVAYSQWRSERGQPIMVEKLEFIGYHKISDKVTKIKNNNGLVYQGEVWKCRVLTTMEIKEFTFKVKMTSNETDVGWEYTKPEDAPVDRWTNPLVDSLSVVLGEGNRSDEPNHVLIDQEIRQEELKTCLLSIIETTDNEHVKKAATARLNFINNPNLATKRLYFDKIKPRYKTIVINLIDEMCI